MFVNRRDFFRVAAATVVALLVPGVAWARERRRPVRPVYALTGGATSDGVVMHATLEGRDAHAPVDLAVSKSVSMSDPFLVGVRRADGDSIVRHTVRGAQPDSTYYARLVSEGKMVGETVRFKTMPTGTTSWTRTIALVSCMGNAADPLSTQLAWQDILDWGPDDIWHLGDWGYWGQEIPPNASYKKDLFQYLRSMRRLETMRRAIQSVTLNTVTISDHELTINGDPEGGIHNSPAAIRELVAFRKLMPVRRYGDTRKPMRGRYYSYDIGDQVRVIVTDFRTPDRSNNGDPDGPNKTMFGTTQLSWLLDKLSRHKVNLIVNETSWLADADRGRAPDKPWFYNHEQQIIADYITSGGYQVAWIGGDRHYVGYLAGQGDVHNTLGNFPCYIGSGMAKQSLDLQPGELMTWQFGAGQTDPKLPVCGYMRLTLSYDDSSRQVRLSGLGRAVLDTTKHVQDWVMSDIPGGTALDTWRLRG